MSSGNLKHGIGSKIRNWMIGKPTRFIYRLTKKKRRLPDPRDNKRFNYQEMYIKFDIRPGWIVLDIGGGHDPFPHATILADLYPGDTQHRYNALVRDGRPFVVMDVQHIGMSDKSVDFLYCSHVLEHTEDPIQACSEIMRVGKRGYIETPTFMSDALFAWAKRTCHRWHVVGIANILVFFEYSERQKEGTRSNFWQEIHFSKYFHPWQEIHAANLDLFNTMFCWQDHFCCVVFRLDGTIQTLGMDCLPGQCG